MSNYIKVLPIQSKGWQRPTEWLPIPNYGVNEEVFYGLYAVWNTSVNPCALLCNGTGAGYTVDWGDGTVTNYAFNVKAERNYVYSALSADTEFRGYRQAMIKVTPRAGAVITLFSIQQRHSNFNYQYVSGFLEATINYANLSALHMGSNFGQILPSYTENLTVKKLPTNIGNHLSGLSGLIKFKAIEPVIGNCSSMFNGHVSLLYVEGDYTQVTNANGMFYNAFSVKDLSNITIGGNLSDTTNMFYGAQNITNFPNMGAITGSAQFQSGGFPKIIPAINLSGATNCSNMFSTRSIIKSLMYGTKVTHSYANQLLDAAALNEIFTNLGTANAGATITITGNPGAATCNQSIATAKGWTVIN
jgi:hypothetical protein